MRKINFVYLLLIIFIVSSCKPKFYNQVTEEELQDMIGFLASDSLKGRKPGTPEDSVLTAWLVEKMDISGLVLGADDGRQLVKAENGFKITPRNHLAISRESITTGPTFSVFGFSATDTVSGMLVYAASVADAVKAGSNGKILLLPYPEDVPSNDYDAYGYLRSQGLAAADLGYEALIYACSSDLPSINNEKRLPLPIPVAAISQNILPQDFNQSTQVDDQSPNDLSLTLETEVLPRELNTYNVIGKLKGSDPKLSDQYIIIGAHHDHLGMGGRGSSSRRQDTIAPHYGADDNASGTAGVIELAQYMISRSPARSFVFTTFAGEEMGLLGSKTFAENPVVDLSKVQVMINMDMIGRLNEERQLQIGGIGTSPVFRQLLDSINQNYNFSITYAEAGYGPSDHSSFYAKDVPVLFISTGAHTDYHTPSDKPEKINYSGLKEVLLYISDVAYELANMDNKIEFTMAGPKEASGSRSRRGGITFGLMPDVMYDGSDGMPVSFVTEGKPAAIGGMKGGDIITAVDGKRVGNVQDYMERLGELKEGQSVVVTVDRDGKSLDLLLQL